VFAAKYQLKRGTVASLTARHSTVYAAL